MKRNELIEEYFIEVDLPTPDSFLKVKETLGRIGIASKKDNTLYQSCHILHKKGKYYIVHFKEMLELDGKAVELTDDDVARRNTIANLLDDWGLVKLVDYDQTSDPVVSISQIKIVPFKEKTNWTFIQKYTIGKKF